MVSPERQIAKKLARSVSTISQEIKRKSVDGAYRSITAQQKSRERNLSSRKAFGHWEADTVDSKYGIQAQRDILLTFPPRARQSVTFDNGKENYNHEQLAKQLNLTTVSQLVPLLPNR